MAARGDVNPKQTVYLWEGRFTYFSKLSAVRYMNGRSQHKGTLDVCLALCETALCSLIPGWTEWREAHYTCCFQCIVAPVHVIVTFAFLRASLLVPAIQKHSRSLDPVGGLEEFTSWYRAWGIFRHWASLSPFWCTGFSSSFSPNLNPNVPLCVRLFCSYMHIVFMYMLNLGQKVII